MTVLAAALDANAAAHLATALEAHRRWCLANGYAMPAALVELQQLATIGQGRTFRDATVPVLDNPTVPPTLLTFAETAKELGISERHARRLADEGRLQVVAVSPRIRRVARGDLDAFVAERRGSRTMEVSA